MTRCISLLFHLSFFIAVVPFLSACTEPASREEMDIPEAQSAYFSDDRYLSGKVLVGNVTAAQDSVSPFSSEIGVDEFEAALRSSLETANLLGEHASASYALDAELIEIDKPGGGWEQTVQSRIRYILRNVRSQEILLNEVIDASGTAWASDAPTGPKIQRIATERSAQSNLKKIINRLYVYDPAANYDYTPDEKRLWSRIEDRENALIDNDYDAWIKMLPTSLVDEIEAEDPKGLRSMFDYYATEYKSLQVLEICDCTEMTSPQGNRVTRCTTVTQMNPAKSYSAMDTLSKVLDTLTLSAEEGPPNAFHVLEMWQYESGEWYWGYTDHHPLSNCP